jgi:hypothetical protein
MVIRIRDETKNPLLFFKNPVQRVSMLFAWLWFGFAHRTGFFLKIENFLSPPDPDPHPASCSNFVLSYRKNIFHTALALRERYRYWHRYFL